MKSISSDDMSAIWQKITRFETPNDFSIVEVAKIFEFELDYPTESIISQEPTNDLFWNEDTGGYRVGESELSESQVWFYKVLIRNADSTILTKYYCTIIGEDSLDTSDDEWEATMLILSIAKSAKILAGYQEQSTKLWGGIAIIGEVIA